MKFIRSWPEKTPEGRCYVIDTLPRFIMKDYCYRGLGGLDDDVLLIEWDVAVHRDELKSFINQAQRNPDEVLVAPYRLYQPTRGERNLPEKVWAHRRYRSSDETTLRFVDEYEPSCHLFGLGLAYLPRPVIQAFLESWPGHFSDGSFSAWHYRNVQQDVSIYWGTRPVHLHYLIERMV